MASPTPPAPKDFKGVMVSSTFTDLKEHRAALMDALRKQGLFAIGMEDYVTAPEDDIISSSLGMVADGHAYIGLISLKYGQTPICPDRNPNALSVTELEFNEADKLKRPILIFIMDEDHPTTKKDVEMDPVKLKKLDAFRERAKIAPGSDVHRIYVTFVSLEEFTKKAIHVAARLRRYLDETDAPKAFNNDKRSDEKRRDHLEPNLIPAPPAFYAEPSYLGSHEFVGRRDQLETLDEWPSGTRSRRRNTRSRLTVGRGRMVSPSSIVTS